MDSCECVVIALPEPNIKGQPVQDAHSSGEAWPPYIPSNTLFYITIIFIDLKIGIRVQKLLFFPLFSLSRPQHQTQCSDAKWPFHSEFLCCLSSCQYILLTSI